MDNETHSTAEGSGSQWNPSIDRATRLRDINMFGCTTTSNFTFTTAPVAPSDLRMIPLSDIDLQDEISPNYSTGVVYREPGQAYVRRIYSARVAGQKSKVTVAMYEGNGAEEKWREDIAKYMSLRSQGLQAHAVYMRPFSMMYMFLPAVYVAISSNLLCLICPQIKGIDLFKPQSVKSSQAVLNYLYPELLHLQHSSLIQPPDYTSWIRHSTGQFCMELMQSSRDLTYIPTQTRTPLQGVHALSAPNAEAVVINTLTMTDYHKTCFYNLCQFQHIYVSTSMPVKLGALVSWPPGDELVEWVDIASPSGGEILFDVAMTWNDVPVGEAKKNGWTWYTILLLQCPSALMLSPLCLIILVTSIAGLVSDLRFELSISAMDQGDLDSGSEWEAIYPDDEADSLHPCVSKDCGFLNPKLDVDDKPSDSEAEGHDPLVIVFEPRENSTGKRRKRCGDYPHDPLVIESVLMEVSNGEHNNCKAAQTSVGDSMPEVFTPHEEIPTVSSTFKLLTNIQLVLISMSSTITFAKQVSSKFHGNLCRPFATVAGPKSRARDLFLGNLGRQIRLAVE
ncbi:hypothetical protein DFH09DRAFT_1095032 [Mycena vulgaris]|nr:hypothetical protein DFH09DRAFT_1095032 [Mycena vulgaris]